MNTLFNKVVKDFKLRTAGDKIHQTDRNNLKIALMTTLKDFLTDNEVEVDFVKEGIAVSTFNEEIGEVNFVIDIKMKDLNFDFETETLIFKEEQEAKLAKKRLKASKNDSHDLNDNDC